MSYYEDLDNNVRERNQHDNQMEEMPTYPCKEVSTLIDSWSFGFYQLVLLILCAAGYFAVCADLLLMVYIQPSLQTSFDISNLQFAFLAFAITMSGNLGSIVM